MTRITTTRALFYVAAFWAIAGCRSASDEVQGQGPAEAPLAAAESLMASPLLGPANAKVTIVEVSDFQ